MRYLNLNKVITGTQAKKADTYAIETMGIPSLSLMETASSKVADYIIRNFPTSPVTIVCGTGNNGADGICIARILTGDRRFNGSIQAVITGDLEHASWEFLHQLSEYKRIGGNITYYRNGDALPSSDVLVDAVFGIGLLSELREDKKDLLIKADSMHYPHVIAVDIPSGINSDTGELMGAGIHAEITVTFGRSKTGLITGAGQEYAGTVIIEDIGIPDEAYDHVLS